MFGGGFPSRLSYCSNRPVNNGMGPNKKSTTICVFIPVESVIAFNMTCSPDGLKMDESTQAVRMKQEPPRGFHKSIFSTRYQNDKQTQTT